MLLKYTSTPFFKRQTKQEKERGIGTIDVFIYEMEYFFNDLMDWGLYMDFILELEDQSPIT